MRPIDADALRNAMYHEAFETDTDMQRWDSGCWIRYKMFENVLEKMPTVSPQEWIPVSERLPSDKERKEWIDKNLGGIGYLYPCLVTRYSSINPERTKNNPYVAKHYFDGEDFLNNGEEVCSKYIIAWMPLPEPYEKGE